MLDATLKAQLQAYLQKLQAPVEIVAALDDTPAAQDMRSLLQELVDLSPLLSWAADTGTTALRQPSFALRQPGQAPRIHFAGLPLGHEFTSLVLALLQTGGHPPRVDETVQQQVRELPGDYRFETYISLSCQNCPEVVQALNLMAVLNPRVHHTMIDGALFQDEVQARQIMAVPSVYLNGQPFAQGRMALEEILVKLDQGMAAREATRLAARPVYDMLVVGGGPAGAAAAIYAARKGIRTGVLTERFGGQVLDTLGIENFVSVAHTEGPQLAAALEQHVRQHEVDIMGLQRAKALIPGELLQVVLESGATLKARSVVISTGARWREMNVPGEQMYRGKGVAYCPHCDGPLFKGKRVAVVGGGNSGVEAAIDLAGIVAQVTLLEFDAQLRADAVLQNKLKSLPNVRVITQALSTEVLGDGQRVQGLRYTDRRDGQSHELALDGIFVQIGLLPNTEWLKDSPVDLSARGEIEVNARGQTSVPGVFAAGDVTTVPFKQIVIAVGEGAKAALGAFDHLIRSPQPVPAAGTAAEQAMAA